MKRCGISLRFRILPKPRLQFRTSFKSISCYHINLTGGTITLGLKRTGRSSVLSARVATPGPLCVDDRRKVRGSAGQGGG